MAVLVRFPKVAPGVEQAMVGAWHKSPGERVAKGEPLVELVTDKATFDLPAEADGVVLHVAAPEKSQIPVNYVLAILGDPGEAIPDVADENRRLLEAHSRRARVAAWTLGKPGGGPSAAAVRATPGARRLARELGVPLEDVAASTGTGVLREEDVRSFAQAHGRTD